MPDLATIIEVSAAHAWVCLPIAIVLGALHALEPGHAKALMAAYIVAIGGTTKQAVVLATSAAVGHTIVVWLLAIAALAFGQRYIVDQVEPWLTVVSGILIMLLALRMFWYLPAATVMTTAIITMIMSTVMVMSIARDSHSLEAPTIHGGVTTGQIVWFGFTGGLMPWPAAIAVLLICVQLKAFALGIAIVAAFSLGIGLTLIAIGLTVVWGASKIFKGMAQF
jgi:nickel/cobalt exporter